MAEPHQQTPPPYNSTMEQHHQDSFTPQPQAAQPMVSPGNEKAALAGYPDPSYQQHQQYQQQTPQHGNDVPLQPMQHQPSYNQSQPAQAPPTGNSHVQQKNNYANAAPLASLERYPAVVDCPICGQREMTITHKVSGGTTHASAALCCLCLCLGCIPYLFDEFKDTLHKCGSCQAHLAQYHRSGSTEILVRSRQ